MLFNPRTSGSAGAPGATGATRPWGSCGVAPAGRHHQLLTTLPVALGVWTTQRATASPVDAQVAHTGVVWRDSRPASELGKSDGSPQQTGGKPKWARRATEPPTTVRCGSGRRRTPRKQAVHRRRRIIYNNNDGDDIWAKGRLGREVPGPAP